MREDQRGIQFHPTAVPFVSIFVSFLAHVLFIFSFLAILSFLTLFIFFYSLFSLFSICSIVCISTSLLAIIRDDDYFSRSHFSSSFQSRRIFYAMPPLSIDSHGSRFLFILSYTLHFCFQTRDFAMRFVYNWYIFYPFNIIILTRKFYFIY